MNKYEKILIGVIGVFGAILGMSLLGVIYYVVCKQILEM